MHLTTIFDRQTTAVGMENCTPTMERKDTHTHLHATHPYTSTQTHCEKITHTHLFFGQNEYERLKRR